MIKIQCSILEQVRKNPRFFGQMLATNNTIRKGGRRGMFSSWQDLLQKVHLGQLAPESAIKELHLRLSSFGRTSANLKKQVFLEESFGSYLKVFKKSAFKFVDSKRHLNWAFEDKGILSGLTPWVVRDRNRYYCYFTLEQQLIQWETELKYPLIQKYLSQKTIQCDETDIMIGYYCLERNDFFFKNFSSREIKQAINEMNDIFKEVDWGLRV